MAHEPTAADLKNFMETPEGKKIIEQITEQQRKAAEASIAIATSLGILVPGMEIEVSGAKFHVIDKAHDHVGAGWFMVSPFLPPEARNQVQMAPLQVLFHPPTAEYEKTALANPEEAFSKVLEMASQMMGS